MRRTPGWYDDEVAAHAQLILNDGETEEQAITSLRVLVRDTHREFGNVILDDWNAPRLATALAAARSVRAAQLREALRLAEEKARATMPPMPPAPPRAQAASLPVPPVAPGARRPFGPGNAISDSAATVIRPQGVPAPPGPESRDVAALRAELDSLEPPSDPEWDLHLTLFADFPYRSLKVTPTRYAKIHEMTVHDLDAARAILFNKTGHAIEGAERERRQFDAFYSKVRPLMNGDDTVADAERILAQARKSQVRS